MVEQQCAQHTDIAWVALVEIQHRGHNAGLPIGRVRSYQALAGGNNGGNELLALGRGNGNPRGEKDAQVGGLGGCRGVVVKHGNVVVQLRALKGGKKLAGARQGAEAGHGIEIRERDNELGLVIIVLVIAIRRGELDAGGVFAGKALFCLRL